MTERGLGPAAVLTAAAGVFCLVLVYLALQLRAGADPAIGAGQQAQAPAPRQVLVRRIVIRRIVEGSDPSGGSDPLPAAPAPAAAPAAAPAPAPAPAPVVTRAS